MLYAACLRFAVISSHEQVKNGVPVIPLLYRFTRLLYPRTDLIGMCF